MLIDLSNFNSFITLTGKLVKLRLPFNTINVQRLNPLKPNSFILVLGCGNSTLSEDLRKLGHYVMSTDYSEVVCQRQKNITGLGSGLHRSIFTIYITIIICR